MGTALSRATPRGGLEPSEARSPSSRGPNLTCRPGLVPGGPEKSRTETSHCRGSFGPTTSNFGHASRGPMPDWPPRTGLSPPGVLDTSMPVGRRSGGDREAGFAAYLTGTSRPPGRSRRWDVCRVSHEPWDLPASSDPLSRLPVRGAIGFSDIGFSHVNRYANAEEDISPRPFIVRYGRIRGTASSAQT